jgi:hypothetical protein
VLEEVGSRIRRSLDDQPIDVNAPPVVDGVAREALVDIARSLGARERELRALAEAMKLEAGIAGLLDRTDRREIYRQVNGRKERRVDLPDWRQPPPDAAVAVVAPYRLFRLGFASGDLLDIARRRESLEERSTETVVIAPYDQWTVNIVDLSGAEKAICESLPPRREIPFDKLTRRLSRQHADADIAGAFGRLAEAGLLAMYSSLEALSRQRVRRSPPAR